MATRTVTASGTVTNIGSVPQTFSVRLLTTHRTAEGVVVGEWVNSVPLASLPPGQVSPVVALQRGVSNIFGGDTIDTVVVLDRMSAPAQSGIDTLLGARYTELTSYEGVLQFAPPTVGARAGAKGPSRGSMAYTEGGRRWEPNGGRLNGFAQAVSAEGDGIGLTIGWKPILVVGGIGAALLYFNRKR